MSLLRLYIAAVDEQVRRSFARLNQLIPPINQPFWQIYYPPNG